MIARDLTNWPVFWGREGNKGPDECTNNDSSSNEKAESKPIFITCRPMHPLAIQLIKLLVSGVPWSVAQPRHYYRFRSSAHKVGRGWAATSPRVCGFFSAASISSIPLLVVLAPTLRLSRCGCSRWLASIESLKSLNLSNHYIVD